MIGLRQRMTVYGEGSGAFTTVVASDIACRLTHLPAQQLGGVDVVDRAALLARRVLLFDPAYTLPEPAVVAVDGHRWNVESGTIAHLVGPTGGAAYGRADVVRAD